MSKKIWGSEVERNIAKQKAYRERNRKTPKKISLTQQQKDKNREDKLFSFKEVRLHLVCCDINKHGLGENGFSFRYRPKKEDIYFNFSGMEYKEEILNIGYHGLNYYVPGRRKVFCQIIKYRKKYPNIKIIDERTTEQKRFKKLASEQGSILHIANKEGWRITDECKKHPLHGDYPGCKLTIRELFIEDTKNPFNNNKYFPGIEEERLKETEYYICREEELISVMRTALNLTYRECVEKICAEYLKDYMDGINDVQLCGKQTYNRILLDKLRKPMKSKHCWEYPYLNDKSWEVKKEDLKQVSGVNSENSPLSEAAGFDIPINVYNRGLPIFADTSGVLC